MTASFADFAQCPKTDTMNHLHLGMRYASFTSWAGFYIPDFPRKYLGLSDIKDNIITPYTAPRCKTAKDVQDLFTLSIQDAIADNVKILEGSVAESFAEQCGGAANLAELVKKEKERFSTKIDFRPDLAIDGKMGSEHLRKWLPELLSSGIFESIALYGVENADAVHGFAPMFALAESSGIKRKISAGAVLDPKTIPHFCEMVGVDEIQCGQNVADDESVMKYLRSQNVALNICFESDVALGSSPSYQAHKIRTLVDFGFRVNLCTHAMLLFNKNNSEQCAELVNSELFSVNEVKKILAASYESHLKR